METQTLHRGRLIDHLQLVVKDLAASLPKQLSQSERPDWSPSRLAALSVPTCIVQGAQTRALFAQVCEALGNAIPACQRLQVADVGHLYPIEQPTLFVQQLLRWLKQQA